RSKGRPSGIRVSPPSLIMPPPPPVQSRVPAPIERQSALPSQLQPPAAQPAAPVSGAPPPAEWVYCGSCGEKIGSDDVYCAHCGSRQPSAGAGAGTGFSAKQSGSKVTAQLLVLGTEDMVKPFVIEKESVLIGRTDPHTGIFPEIDLTMYDPETKVSR